MIDIHTHILPGVDDGARTVDESVEMARLAAAAGTTGMICTSHSAEWFEIGRLPVMEEQVQALRAALQAAGVALDLWPGMEIFLSPHTPRHLKEGRAWTLAGSQYVLVEVPYEPWPVYAEQTLFELQVQGYTPILAHPERYVPIQHDPNLMCRLAERGVLGQVTADAFTGAWGDATRRCAITLSTHGLVQFLASDTHSPGRARRPEMSRGHQALVELVGPAQAEAMATTAPQRVVAGQPVVADPRPVEPPRSFFSRLFGSRQGS